MSIPFQAAGAQPLSAEEWAELRRQACQVDLQAIGASLPEVLLSYQARLLTTTATNEVTVVEKSRRIGATWGVGADAVLTAGASRSAGGMDVLYIGYSLDMAREFIDACGMWARAFLPAAAEAEEFLFKDQDEKGADRDIQAFRIRFWSGYEIIALSSRPRSLRGKQGYVIIDEAAFHDDLAELLKAAFALLIWGGRVLVISTHDGKRNAFNELVEEIRAGKKPYALLRITFDEALQDGLYQRVCLVTSKPWSPEAEAEWRQRIRATYGDGASEELDVIPREGGGKAIPRILIEARKNAGIPVFRWRQEDSFKLLPDYARHAAALAWCEEHLKPILSQLDPTLRSAFGEDFARSADFTTIWPVQILPDLVRRPPMIVELKNIPFDEQWFILQYIGDRLPRLCGGALDARGNGQYLAEKATNRWGAERIHEVMLTEGWYREHMPKLRAAFEDGTWEIPADADIADDYSALVEINGVIRVPTQRVQGVSGQRHGDAAVAGGLAQYATFIDATEYGYEPATPRPDPRRPDLDDDMDGPLFGPGAW
jgi:phage FluMu gp28-like protein